MTPKERDIYIQYVQCGDIEKVALDNSVSTKRVQNIIGMGKHEIGVVTISEGLDEQLPTDYDASTILVLGDTHIPYHHPKMFEFLEVVMDYYNPTMVVHVGDEVEHHAISFHTSDPDLRSSGDELMLSTSYIGQLYEMFPEMLLLHSNHGSLAYRRAKEGGVSRHYLRPYKDVLGTPQWKWFMELTLDLPNGTQCYFHHGKSANVLRLSQSMGMNCVQGHYHEQSGVQYWSNPNNLLWGMQVGCLIDRKSLAYTYNNCNLKRPVLSVGVIVEGVPHIIPMEI